MNGEYDGQQLTDKWVKRWMDEEEYQEIYRFDREDWETKFIIDTPPPFTTGIPHMGHVMWWSINDTIARYKRMQGHNVLLPQGWDCQGLPTEVKVEEEFGISPDDTETFLAKCQEYTEDMIAAMKSRMTQLGYMPDWEYEYRTMDDSYHEMVQRSLLRFVDDDLIYQREFPNHWCPDCETAIAKAEIEREQRDAPLWTIEFGGPDGEPIPIATTRPELLPACVAVGVHPDDEDLPEDESVTIPLLDRDVPVIIDEEIDPEFGTGVVMICTFGDEEDRNWVYEYGLDIIDSVDEHGHLTAEMGPYAGMPVMEARDAIVEDLADEGTLIDETTTSQERGVHDRCGTPAEIILTEQWFVNVLDHTDEMLDRGDEIEWLPPYMKKRYEDWAEGLNWDWVISRQRNFGTPLPFWACGDCGHIAVPDEEDLPVDPRTEPDRLEECPECGGGLEPSDDVADCWVDSSISALRLVEWEEYDHWEQLYPVELREQGHDIIRTWAFYSIFRCTQLTDDIPWQSIYLNGMVLDENGKKMSKSTGNVVTPDDILDEYDADSIRQGLLQISPGDDIPFSLKDVEHGQRFVTKYWNICRFAAGTLEEYDQTTKREDVDLDIIDEWMLAEVNRYLDELEQDYEEYSLNNALDAIHDFVWHTLADNYIEIAKQRLYSGDEEEKRAAQYTLSTVLNAVTRSMAPLIPFVTEEVYHELFESDEHRSVHGEPWPSVAPPDDSAAVLEAGRDALDVIEALRRYKSENDLSLNHELDSVVIYAPDGFDLTEAVSDAMQIDTIEVRQESPNVSENIAKIDLDYSAIGPKYGGLTKAIEQHVEDPSGLDLDDGVLSFEADGEQVELAEGEDFEAVRQYTIPDEEGSVYQTREFALLIN